LRDIPAGPDGFELRLLLVAQFAVETVERGLDGLDRLQHRVEALAGRR